MITSYTLKQTLTKKKCIQVKLKEMVRLHVKMLLILTKTYHKYMNNICLRLLGRYHFSSTLNLNQKEIREFLQISFMDFIVLLFIIND